MPTPRLAAAGLTGALGLQQSALLFSSLLVLCQVQGTGFSTSRLQVQGAQEAGDAGPVHPSPARHPGQEAQDWAAPWRAAGPGCDHCSAALCCACYQDALAAGMVLLVAAPLHASFQGNSSQAVGCLRQASGVPVLMAGAHQTEDWSSPRSTAAAVQERP